MRKNKPRIGIIDLESNNLYSIYNSCLISGFKPKIISPKEKTFNYDLVIMPGVGAFKTGMRVLKRYYYDDKILYLTEDQQLIDRLLNTYINKFDNIVRIILPAIFFILIIVIMSYEIASPRLPPHNVALDPLNSLT